MQVTRTMEYEGSTIMVIQHMVLWQYFFTYESDSYMQYAYAWPPWWRWLMLPFGGKLYGKEEKNSAEDSMLQGAVASIEKIKDKHAKRNSKKAKGGIQRHRKRNS